jgi:predicted dehydrogenase
LPGLFDDEDPHELALSPSDGWITSFQRMWEDYAAAIRGEAPALVSGEDGREVVRIVRAAYESMELDQTVTLAAA